MQHILDFIQELNIIPLLDTNGTLMGLKAILGAYEDVW